VTSNIIIAQREARAIDDALETLVRLDTSNEALKLAKDEPVRDPNYAAAEIVSSLARVCLCLHQQMQIGELAERLEALEVRFAPPAAGEE
jgi:hypothetical protein